MAAAVGMLILGAIFNAGAFTGGNKLAKSISGDNNEEEKRHNLATEKYEKDYDDF